MLRTIFSEGISATSSVPLIARSVKPCAIWLARPPASNISTWRVSGMSGTPFPGLDGAGPARLTVSPFDIRAPFEPGIHFQGVGVRDANARFTGDGILASGDRHERSAGQRRRLREGHLRHVAGPARQGKILA